MEVNYCGNINLEPQGWGQEYVVNCDGRSPPEYPEDISLKKGGTAAVLT